MAWEDMVENGCVFFLFFRTMKVNTPATKGYHPILLVTPPLTLLNSGPIDPQHYIFIKPNSSKQNDQNTIFILNMPQDGLCLEKLQQIFKSEGEIENFRTLGTNCWIEFKDKESIHQLMKLTKLDWNFNENVGLFSIFNLIRIF
jgi:hypothetical protein